MTLTHIIYSSVFLYSFSSSSSSLLSVPPPSPNIHPSIHPANASYHLHPIAANLWCHKDWAVNLQHAGSRALTPNFTLCLWYWLLYSVNKIQVKDKVVCAAWFSVQIQRFAAPTKFLICARATFSQNKSDMLFFTFPPIERALKDPRHHSSLVQPWPSEPVFDQLPCFLSKQRATGGNCVYRAERRSQSPVKSQGHRDTCLVFLLQSGLNIPGTR